MAYTVLASTLAFAVVYSYILLRAAVGGQVSAVALSLRSFQAAVEIGASFYAFAAIFSAIAYLILKEEEPKQAGRRNLAMGYPQGAECASTTTK